MNSLLRLVAVGLAALAVLVGAGSAFGQTYEPSLQLSPGKHALGAKGGVGIVVDSGECCFAPGRITLYSPLGYAVKVEHEIGARVGSFTAMLRVSGGEDLAVGFIAAENPSNYLANTCAPGRHDAVWIFEFETRRYRFRVPMYVDRVTAGPEAAYASAQMVICFASPQGPPPQGAPAGISIDGMAFGVSDIFTNPTTAGSYGWNAVFVPYAPGTATLSAELTAQSTSYVRLPVGLAVTVKRLRPGSKVFLVTACLRENGDAVSGVRVQIVGRPRPRGDFTRFGHGRTDSRGCIMRRVRVANRVILGYVWTDPLPRAAAGCSVALAPRCSRPTIASFYFQRAFRLRR